MEAAAEQGNEHEVSACSACAGDYEDPDRTVWPIEESEEAENEGALEDAEDEFSAEK